MPVCVSLFPVHRMFMIKEIPHDWSLSLDSENPEAHMKEEEERLWISQEEELLTVKIKDGEKPHLSELYQIQTEDHLETEVPTSSSPEPVAENFRRPEPDRDPEPGYPSQQSNMADGEKSFGCNLCDKRFRRKHFVKLHMMTHTGKREHSCDLCGKGFVGKRSLQTQYPPQREIFCL